MRGGCHGQGSVGRVVRERGGGVYKSMYGQTFAGLQASPAAASTLQAQR